MKKTKISPLLLFLAILAAVLLIYTNYYYLPTSATVNQLTDQHQQNVLTLNELQIMAAQEKQTQKQIDALQNKLTAAQAKDSLPARRVADDVTAGCAAAGVTFDAAKLNVQEPVAIKGKTASGKLQLYGVPLSFSVGCNNTQLQTLIHYFEQQSTGAYYVNSVKYSTPDDKKSALTAELSLTLYNFAAPQKASTAAAPSASSAS